MKIGLGSYAYRYAIGTRDFQPPSPMTPFTFLEQANKMGAEVIQICDNLPLEPYRPQDLDHLATTARHSGIDMELGINTNDINVMHRYLHYAEQLNSKLLRIVFAPTERTSVHNQALHVLDKFLPALGQTTIVLAIENHFSMTPAELVSLVQTINDPQVKICLDPFNSIARLVGPEATIDTLLEHAASVHIKDATVARYNTGFIVKGCSLGQGLLDVRYLLARVQEITPSANICLEMWMDAVKDTAQNLRQEQEWVQESFALLKNVRAQIAPS